MRLLSVGMNRKLGKDIGIFNLPSGATCPKATTQCQKICYARKAERIYKSALEKRKKNLAATKGLTFVADMIAEIQLGELKKVRLHESGDVYDQAYLDSLICIARLLPDVKFLIYTKSWHLDWSSRPSNMMVYWSIDKTTVGIPPRGLVAMTVAKGDLVPMGLATCCKTKDKNYCGDGCETCWDGSDNVYFRQH